MALTPKQISELMQILHDGSTAIAIRTAGHVVPREEFDRLQAQGYLPATLVFSDMIADSYKLGMLMQQQEPAKAWNYAQLSDHLRANPVPLGPAEKRAVDIAQRRAGIFCVGLGNRFSAELGAVIVDADQELAQRTREGIQRETSTAIAKRETVKQLKSRLGNLTGDWARDWDRIAATETHMAHQEGVADEIASRDGDEQMAKVPEPDACSACREHYLENGKPRVMPVSWWHGNGTTNAGRKRPDWKPVLGAMHPWCKCQNVRVPFGWGFNDAWDLVPLDEDEDTEKSLGRVASVATLQKAGGPFVGPRGGKWADPQHTIPWKDEHKAGDVHRITMHGGIFGSERKVKIVTQHVKDGMVTMTQQYKGADGTERSGSSFTMPGESVKHFKNDLAGKVDLPLSGRKEIDAVISGKAKLLGKGDDGVAFQVGDKVVKVSTTVPFQPENPGHLTPEDAANRTKSQVEIGNKLIAMGVPGLQESEFVRHGDKGFQIKDWVEIPEKLTLDQLDTVQRSVIEMHKRGYAVRDAIQVGLDKAGNPVMFDIGKAGPLGTDMWQGENGSILSDMDSLKVLYADHGSPFARLDGLPGQQDFLTLKEGWDKLMSTGLAFALAPLRLSRVIQKMQSEAKATLTGDKLKERLEQIEEQTWAMQMDVEDLKEKHAYWTSPKGKEEAARLKAEKKAAAEDAGSATLQKSRKLHARMKFQGFEISIENRKGSFRHWYDRATKTEGKTEMLFPYGYIRKTEGADGEHVDVFVGPDASAEKVFVIHQRKAPDFTAFDEDKIMLGFASRAHAKSAYLKHYNDKRFFGTMDVLGVEDFRRKVYGAKGEMIKGGQLSLFKREPLMVEWLWALQKSGVPFMEFADVVKAAQHGDRSKLDEVYEHLEKAGATESLYVDLGLDLSIVGHMGIQSYPKEKKNAPRRTPLRGQAHLDWPIGREDVKIPNRRPKNPKLMLARDRFDVRGVRSGDKALFSPVSGYDQVVQLKPDRKAINEGEPQESLKVQQESRMKLRQGMKLHGMEIKR